MKAKCTKGRYRGGDIVVGSEIWLRKVQESALNRFECHSCPSTRKARDAINREDLLVTVNQFFWGRAERNGY
jgi:hypothetical protein